MKWVSTRGNCKPCVPLLASLPQFGPLEFCIAPQRESLPPVAKTRQPIRLWKSRALKCKSRVAFHLDKVAHTVHLLASTSRESPGARDRAELRTQRSGNRLRSSFRTAQSGTCVVCEISLRYADFADYFEPESLRATKKNNYRCIHIRPKLYSCSERVYIVCEKTQERPHAPVVAYMR